MEEGAGKSSTIGETVPKLIGHIEKMETEDVEAEKEEVEDDGNKADKGTARVAGKDKDKDRGATKSTTDPEKPTGRRVMKSITSMTDARKQAKIKEQECKWSEATK